MAAVQEIGDRTALVTGKGLRELAVTRFYRTGRSVLAVLLVALIVANALNVAADLVAVGSGMKTHLALGASCGCPHLNAAGTGLLCPHLPRLQGPLRRSVVLSRRGRSRSHQWGSILVHTIIPHIEFNKAYLALLVPVLATTISPYLFFWQSAHRLEEMRDEPQGGERAQPLKRQSPTRARREVHQSPRRLRRHGVLQPGDVRHHRGHCRDPARARATSERQYRQDSRLVHRRTYGDSSCRSLRHRRREFLMSIHREDRGQNGASALLHPSARILATSLERFPFGLKGRPAPSQPDCA
jgi:hypothetical protein